MKPNRKQRRAYKRRKAKGLVADQSGFAHGIDSHRKEYIEQRHLEHDVEKQQERRHIEAQWSTLELLAEVPESVKQRTAAYYASLESNGEGTDS